MHPPVAACPDDGFTSRGVRRLVTAGALRPVRGRSSSIPWLRLSLGCGAVITGLAYFLQRQDPPAVDAPVPSVRPSAASAPPPIWMPIARPLPIYRLDAAQPKPLPLAFAARRNGAGAREDTLTLGSFEHEAEPHLRLILHRSLHPEPDQPSLFLDLARRASGAAGLAVTRSTPAEGLVTKFGLMETSEVTLSDVSERTCLGFRFVHPEVGLRVVGWQCPAKGQAIDRPGLACMIGHLSLAEAGNDEPLKALFAQAHRQTVGGCAPAPLASGAEPGPRQARPGGRSPPRQAKRAPEPATAAQKGSAALRREPARRAAHGGSNPRG